MTEHAPSPGETPPSDPARAAEPDAAHFQSHMRAARSELEARAASARADFEEANNRIKARTGRDLIVAILIGLAIGAVVLVSILFANWPFALFATAVALLGVFELARALQASGYRVDLVPQLVAGFGILASGYAQLSLWMLWVVVVSAIVFLVVWRLVAQMSSTAPRSYRQITDDLLVGAFVPLYVPFLASLALVLLRQDAGEWWILAFLIVVVVADTGAYVSGLTFGRGGRHPMAPKISPNKTWEGFAGAALVAVAAGILLAVFMLHIPWWAGVLFGALVLATATVGDLGESMIKRDLGIKDMSSWLPGHGGVLDRLDSILPSAVAGLALYYLLQPLAVT